MWTWYVLGSAASVIAVAWLARRRERPDQDLEVLVDRIVEEVRAAGPEYGVRGIVPGTLTMVASVRGQEVPVPLENIVQHAMMFPHQIDGLVRQLLDEIEEVGLERPADRLFSDAATQILPQICPTDWIAHRTPAFGDGAMVQHPIGPRLAICYVIDDPWSMVFVCQAHLRQWGRSADDLFHLAVQNLRRRTGAQIRIPDPGPVAVRTGDGYDAARLLLLDGDLPPDLLVALPDRDTFYLGRDSAAPALVELATATPGDGTADHALSAGLFRWDGCELVPVSVPVPESAATGRTQ